MAKHPRQPEFEPQAPLPERTPTPAPEPSVKAETPVSPASPVTQNITVLSELDSYILERQKSQPKTLEAVEQRIEVLEQSARTKHRLTLPEYFEQRSYDHDAAKPFVFRWLFKEKRAIDRALNVIGWTLVNRTYFPDAPSYLFTANGGVEVGDSILAFLPAKRAVALRLEPGEKSRRKLAARMTKVEEDYVLMTGNPQDERVYKPSMGPEEHEAATATVGGELVEGRDF